MKRFIYLYAILGLVLISQSKSSLAQNCSSVLTNKTIHDDGHFSEDSQCRKTSKKWFNKKRNAHSRGKHKFNKTITLAKSNFIVSGITQSVALKKDSCFICSEQKAQTLFISKLLISAQGTSSTGGTMQVVINGEVKGTIHVPKNDPAYIVNVQEIANSIEFVPVSGKVKVLDIKVVGSKHIPANYNRGQRRSYNKGHYRDYSRDKHYVDSTRSYSSEEYHEDYFGYYNQAQEMSLRSIDIVNELINYSSYKALGKYLLPIKKSAAKVYSIASSAQYSKAMLKAFRELADNLAVGRPYISQVLESTALFNIAMELLSFEEELRSITGYYATPSRVYSNQKESLKSYFKNVKENEATTEVDFEKETKEAATTEVVEKK